MRYPILIAILLVGVAQPLVAQPGTVGQGEHVEIRTVSNPYTLERGLAFPLLATVKNHETSAVTVALFVTLHERRGGDPCSAGSSHWEVTHRTQDGEVYNVHRTVRLAAGQTMTVPAPGEDWVGIVDGVNRAPDGRYRLCYWVESPDKAEEGPNGGMQSAGPWFYDRHATEVEVVTPNHTSLGIASLEVPSSLAAGQSFAARTTLSNPFPESRHVRLTGHLHAPGGGCDGQALERVLGPLDVRIEPTSDRAVGFLGQEPWQGHIPESLPNDGAYLLCLQARDLDHGETARRGTTLNLRAHNSPPMALLRVEPSHWAAGDQLTFHAATSDADDDPVTLSWDFAGAAVARGEAASFTFPFADTYHVSLIIHDGFEATRLDCLVPVPGHAADVHGCPIIVPESAGFLGLPIPGTSALGGLGLLAVAAIGQRFAGRQRT